MSLSTADQKAWLDQVVETTIDPAREIIDPHHHMWRGVPGGSLPAFLLEDLWNDTESGHNIKKTVFMECGTEYRTTGPAHLLPVGETEFVTAAAQASRSQGKAEIAALVAHTDLTQDPALIREVLDAHELAGQGLFRGIRHGGAHDADQVTGWLNATHMPDLYEQAEFRRGVALLGELGLTYDTWHYHFQNADYLALAQAVPNTVMVLDHFGSPVRVGPFADKQDEVFEQWKKDIKAISQCDNVVAKIGGLAMPCNGYGWAERATPPTSDEVVEAQRDYYLYAIECFGPDRCMFESNFPVDKLSLSYHIYWNAMKKITVDFSEADKQALFSGTAARVYKL
ncbi:MAG: L-fuconolactonase [Candidatus Pseudothioglobus sp.]|jgi:L-fuconolactonase